MSEKTDKIKKHFRDHKEAYITGGVCLVIGAAVTYLVVKGHGDAELDESVKVLNELNGVFYKSPITLNNVTVTELVRRGHPGNKILCNQTGEIFASQKRAALANMIDPAALSRHLAGKLDDVKGFTFENLGEMV